MDKILPYILATLTQAPRYKVRNLRWPKESITGKIFRLYELVFWRKIGIRAECQTIFTDEGQEFRAYTWEAKITHSEHELRQIAKRLMSKVKSLRLPNFSIPDMFAPQFAIAGLPSISFGEDERGKYMSFALAWVSTAQHSTNNNVTYDGSTGSDRHIVAFICAGSNQDITGMTWNSEAFSHRVNITNATTNRYNSLWSLEDPVSTGSQEGIWTGSLTDGMGTWCTVVYSGAGATKNTTSGSSSGTNGFTLSITADNGDWIFAQGQNNAANTVYGANTTQRQVTSSLFGGDSNGTASPTALAFNIAAGNANWGACGMAMSPAAAAGPANVKTWNGLAKASVKTVNGLAIASVKTINGLN